MTQFVFAAIVTATLIVVGIFGDINPVRIIDGADPTAASYAEAR